MIPSKRFAARNSSDQAAIDESARRLQHYLLGPAAAAGALAGTASSSAAIVGSNAVIPFGINEEVNIDFDMDGQIDFQIDHDRYNLNGVDLDYLQIDKNDVSSASNPIPIDGFTTFASGGQVPNGDHGYLTEGIPGDLGFYPAALTAGTQIGPDSTGVWDFQEGSNFNNQGGTIRANRLIDEDATQIDTDAGAFVQTPFGSPGWIGLGGDVRYLGLRLDLRDEAMEGLNPGNRGDLFWYGWVGVRITNEADATGEVVGYAYNDEMGMSLLAGEGPPPPLVIPGDTNGDGAVNFGDLAGFSLALTDPAAYQEMYPGLYPDSCDTDGSGACNFGDLASFSGLLTGVGASADSASVPEPGTLLMVWIGAVAMLASFCWRRVTRR